MPHPMFQKFHALSDYEPARLPKGERREAAVLIPLLRRNTHQLVYTQRAQHLNKHPGQISFPGGSLEPGEDAFSAAVRETWEEVGIQPETVELLGEVDEAYSPRGYHIRCFVGLCHEYQPVINHDEVERLVEVDLDELFDDSLHETRSWQDRLDVHYFNFDSGLVWGVTGYITWRLREILRSMG